MTQQTTVWAQLAVSNAIQYAIPFIDGTSLQPTLDSGNVLGVPTSGGLVYKPSVSTVFSGMGALSVGTAGDLTGVDPINAGAQIDSYIPINNQVPGSVGGVPGHTVSSSRGTRYVPSITLTGDLLGEFAGYGLVTTGGSNSYQKLGGINVKASGASATYPGGTLTFGTRADGGATFTEWLSLDQAGVLTLSTGASAGAINIKNTANPLGISINIDATGHVSFINTSANTSNLYLGNTNAANLGPVLFYARGAVQAALVAAAGSVDYLALSGGIGQVVLGILGVTTNCNMVVNARGTGGVYSITGGGTQCLVSDTPNSDSWVTITGAAAANNPKIGSSTKNLILGTGNAIATGATAGHIMIPTCAGSPTGAVTDEAAGRVPFIYDTSANKLWVRSGGTWRQTVALT